MREGAEEGAGKLLEIIRMSTKRLNGEEEETWIARLRLIVSASTSMINTQVKVDETAARLKQVDHMSELMERIADEERRRPLRRLAPPDVEDRT